MSNNEYFTRAMSVVIVVSILFLIIGVYLGEQHAGQSQTVTTVYKTISPGECIRTYTFPRGQEPLCDRLDFMDNITSLFVQTQYALDTARATYMFIDEHVTIESYVSNHEIEDVMKSRRTYFSDKTIKILDMVLKRASELKPVGNVSQTDIKLLNDKLTEMHQLAVQLRTIAYKERLTNNDVYQANAIIENMEKLNDDIYKLAKELIKNA